VVVRTPDGQRLAALLSASGGTVTSQDGQLAVSGLSTEQVGELAARERIVLHELRRADGDLEAAFFDLTAAPEEVAR
jgi:ABC-2 type transport system ATP-binding protein